MIASYLKLITGSYKNNIIDLTFWHFNVAFFLKTDAFDYAILLQESKDNLRPVLKSVTATKRKYSVSEKELLTIVSVDEDFPNYNRQILLQI